MTRTISLITATVGAALLLAVPAYGDSWGADQKSQSVGYLNPDTADRAAAAKQQQVTTMLEAREQALGVSVENRVDPLVARERALDTKNQLVIDSDFYADGFARAISSDISRPEPVRDDRFRLDSANTPSVTATSSGTEIDVPQIGIGLGVGLLLALGLYVAVRFTRSRPFAH